MDKVYLSRYAYPKTLIKAPPPKGLNAIIVIPCHNEPELFKTLDSLYACKKPSKPVEVIIVINQPENASSEIIKQNQVTFENGVVWAENVNTNAHTTEPETRHYSSNSLENTSTSKRFGHDYDNNSYGGFHKPEMTAYELRRAKREVYENLQKLKDKGIRIPHFTEDSDLDEMNDYIYLPFLIYHLHLYYRDIFHILFDYFHLNYYRYLK